MRLYWLLLPLVLGLSSLVLTGCFMPVVNNKDANRAKALPRIPYVQLTTEKTHPVSYHSPERVNAIKTFATTRDCLIESEQLADDPDLRLIDWKNIRSRPALEVCLWRIFSSLEDFQSILKWVSFHKLDPSAHKFDDKVFESFNDLRVLETKQGETYHHGSFYWHKKLPFRDREPVPRYAVAGFWIKVYFNPSDQRPAFVNVGWSTTM